MSKLELTTAATDLPLSLGEAKDHLRVTSNDEDTQIERLIRAATARLEKLHNTQFVTATWTQYADSFGDFPLVLRKPPLIAVSSVKYYDTDGNLDTVADTVYEAGDQDGRAIVRLKYNQTWPSDCRGHEDDVQIAFTAGYGAATAVPEPIKQALLLQLADWYEQRETFVVGVSVSPVPLAVGNLMAGYSYKTVG